MKWQSTEEGRWYRCRERWDARRNAGFRDGTTMDEDSGRGGDDIGGGERSGPAHAGGGGSERARGWMH